MDATIRTVILILHTVFLIQAKGLKRQDLVMSLIQSGYKYLQVFYNLYVYN